jgi:preprotein translocase subunit SecE
MLQVRVLPDPPLRNARGKNQAREMKKRGSESAVSNETQSAPKSGGPGEWVAQGRTFADEAVTELKRVYWPSRKETTAFTWVVLVVVAFVSLYLGVVDYLISLIMRVVFRT